MRCITCTLRSGQCEVLDDVVYDETFNMSVTITLASTTDQVQQVINLGDRNTGHLGHFPKSAYAREAAKGRVIVALDVKGAVLGYVLFRNTRDRAVVQHICVDAPARGHGIGRLLADELKRRTKHLPFIICHCARDYQEIEVWKKLGFVPVGEKRGRGRDQRPLIRLAFDHGHEHLFSSSVNELALSTVVAVMDVNVCLDIQDAAEDDPEIDALRSDWLLEEVSLWVTDETLAEVERQDDTAERQRRMAFLRGQNALRRDLTEETKVYFHLAELLGCGSRCQDRSDLRQVAQAVVGGADVFLTRDGGLLRFAAVVREQFDLELLRPADLVVQLDEIARADDYAPERLHGSAIEGHLVRQSELDGVVGAFLNHARGETRSRLSDLLREHVAVPQRSMALVVGDDSVRHRALMLLTSMEGGTTHVAALRVAKDRLAETLSRHLLVVALQHARACASRLVVVDEQCPVHPLESALRTMGFLSSGAKWVKPCIGGLVDSALIESQVRKLCESVNPFAEVCEVVGQLCAAVGHSAEGDAELERLIWPGRLWGSPLRTFVVPIRPRFARNLFDRVLAQESVFGGDPMLVLNCENVYYRSSHIKMVTAPARILWYVTADPGERVRQLRAISSVLATEVGPAKELFRKYRRLGVYEWGNVQSLTDGDPAGEIMAIRFGPTECFPRPVSGPVLRRLIQQARGTAQPPPLTMPVEVPPACFEALCELAYDQ